MTEYARIVIHDANEQDAPDNIDVRYDPGLGFVYFNGEEQHFTLGGDTTPTYTCVRLNVSDTRRLAYWLLEVTG